MDLSLDCCSLTENEGCFVRLEHEASNREMEISTSPSGPEEHLGRKLLQTLSESPPPPWNEWAIDPRFQVCRVTVLAD